MTAAAQLRRLLLIIPHLADGKEHSFDELSEHVGADRETLVSDLRSLVTRFDEPGGFVEGVMLFLSADGVSLNSRTFLRPMRLTSSELGALDLGLAMLRAERAPDERQAIDRARERLAKVLIDTPADAVAIGERHAALPDAGDPAILRSLRQALRDRRLARIEYRKANGTSTTTRVVRPYGLIVASGRWYLIAHCERSRDLRIFRIDRIAGAAILDAGYDIPATFSIDDVLDGRRVLRPGQPDTMRVRYSPRIARWIAEREGVSPAPDGSLTIEHPLADIHWGVRHVLQYGADAEVLEPAVLREELARRLASLGG